MARVALGTGMDEAPYNVDQEVSSLCATGLRPQILTGVLLRLLTEHFSDGRRIQEPQLKGYIWNSDPGISRISIMPVWHWLTRGAQKRPALLIKRNALQPRTLGLGDGLALISETHAAAVPNDSPGLAQVAVDGSHTVFALSSAAAEAELLSTEVFCRLLQYQQIIQDEFSFQRFRVAEVGPLHKLEEHSETFVVPVNLAYAYIDAWQLVSSAPFLKSIALQLQA